MSGEDTDVEDASDDEVTIWSPEPTGSDEIVTEGVENWINSVEFVST